MGQQTSWLPLRTGNQGAGIPLTGLVSILNDAVAALVPALFDGARGADFTRVRTVGAFFGRCCRRRTLRPR